MGYESGLSVAMRKLSSIQELWKHSHLTALICRRLVSILPQDYITIFPENLCLAALFHDLGKVDWPEQWFFLSKEKLSESDFAIMKEHPLVGAKMLENLVPGIPKEIIKLVANHHERPGGKGYPKQLKEVSREALVLAACDVYCACTETRPYRKNKLTPQEALDIIATFAPQEILQGLWALKKEGCHEYFRFSIGREIKVMGTGI